MALPFLALAIPVLHSSGAWIASSAATGYIAGTLSGTWVGAFVLGNASLLTGLGLVSSAGVASAMGLLGAFGTGSAALAGKALSMVGLGGLAANLGIAPAAVTVLGITPVGWALAGTALTVGAGLAYYLSKGLMARLNAEREKGGLEPITPTQILREVRDHETHAQNTLYTELAEEFDNVVFDADKRVLRVGSEAFSLDRLRYLVNADGSEVLMHVPRLGRDRVVLVVKSSSRQASDEEVAPA